MKMKNMSKIILLICLINGIKGWTGESLWEFTMKNITKSARFFLIDPDNIIENKKKEPLVMEMLNLYTNFGLSNFLFIIKKFDEKNINEKFLNDTIDLIETNIKKELTEKLEKGFISIISTEDNVYKYKYGREIKSRAYKRNLRDLKEVTEKYMKTKEFSSIFNYQLREMENIIEGNDDILPWWDDEQTPHIIDDPDSPEFDTDVPVVPTDNTDKDKDKNKNKKKNEKTGNGVFVVIIICLCFLIAFLIWLFFALAKRVKRMNVNNIDYNMFENQFKL